MEDGKYHRHRGQARLLLDAHGDAPSVVGDPDDVVGQNLRFDVGAVALQRLVDGVVHDLIDQVVQPLGPGGANVHTGPLADRLQPLQHLYLIFVVLIFLCSVFVFQGLTVLSW